MLFSTQLEEDYFIFRGEAPDQHIRVKPPNYIK